MRDKIAKLLQPNASTEVKLSVISMFIGKMMGVYENRLVALEERQLQKGDKGDSGSDGKNGANGSNGLNGKDGSNGADGIDGKDGKDGKAGTNGKDGVGVVDAEIAFDDHLVLKLSNGNEIDAGPLPDKSKGYDVFVSGNSYQIAVSAP